MSPTFRDKLELVAFFRARAASYERDAHSLTVTTRGFERKRREHLLQAISTASAWNAAADIVESATIEKEKS